MKKVEVVYTRSEVNWADSLIKALGWAQFEEHRSILGGFSVTCPGGVSGNVGN